MTQQTAAPSDVLEVEPLPACPWQVGKTYWCRNHHSKALIVSTRLRAGQPIAGILLGWAEGDEDAAKQWSLNGLFNAEPGVLDLTTELA